MSGKTCLITGSSRGLGKYLANFFLKTGHNLILVSSQKENLEKTYKEFKKKHKKQVHIVVTDLSKDGFEKELFRRIDGLNTQVSILVNNAAIQGPIGPFVESSSAEWKKTFNINLFAPAIISSEIVKRMDKKGGTILNISGGGAAGLRPNFSAYASSKTALVRFSETLAAELKNQNINVNAIAPGPMPTDMLKEVVSLSPKEVGEEEFENASRVLSGEGDMEIVAKLCYFLCYEGRNITGRFISAKWDNWSEWNNYLDELNFTDLYTLRRIIGKDRGKTWGDNE